MVIVTPMASRRPQVLLGSAAARQAGIRAGRPLAEALAIEPELCACEEDPTGDRRKLEQLADRMVRYSPCVGLEDGSAPECLLADITGCGPVFKGEDRLVQRAAEELRQAGWTARLAVADTIGAAWALAHFAHTPCRAPVGVLEPILRELPVAALRLSPEAVQLLDDLGIARIGGLLELPRAQVPARFGPEVLQRLDQALGRVPEVIRPCRMLGEIEATHRFEYAVDRLEVLRFVLERLTEEVQRALAERGWGARQLECLLHHETAGVSKLEVSLFRPSQAFAHLWGLLRTRFEQVRVTEPVAALSLRVVSGEPVAKVQAEFVDEDQTAARHETALLIDRLSSRLGRDAVTRPTLVADPQPEYACRFEPVIEREAKVDAALLNQKRRKGRPASHNRSFDQWPRDRTRPRRTKNDSLSTDPEVSRFAQRPLSLWPTPARIEVLRVVPGGRPARFRWQGQDFLVTRAWGPERIETGWWRGHDVERDYYVVATHTGTRFWLFQRHGQEDWFLHGCFD